MNTESSSSKIVTTKTWMLALSWRILRVASMPFTSSICRPIKTTSGCICAARITASSPVLASPTTSNSGTDKSREIIPFLKTRGPCEGQRAERRDLCGFNGFGSGLEKGCRFLVQQS
jgi:hypothetical protein